MDSALEVLSGSVVDTAESELAVEDLEDLAEVDWRFGIWLR